MLRRAHVAGLALALTLGTAHAKLPGERLKCADPGVLRTGSTWWVIGTGGLIRRTEDLARWKSVGRLMAKGLPAWSHRTKHALWAPEIRRVGSRFLCFYALPDPSGYHCVGVSVASSPAGPWRHSLRPLAKGRLVTDRGVMRQVGLIDPTYFRDPRTSRHYLLWKENSNALVPKQRTWIVAQELNAAGTTRVGKPFRLVQNDQGWEHDLVEAPTLVYREGYYYLFYSGATYTNASYGVGVARARSLGATFEKKRGSRAPVLHSGSRLYGPGHQDVARTTNGRWLLFYHVYEKGGPLGHERLLAYDELHWENGWPRVHDGTPSGHGG